MYSKPTCWGSSYLMGWMPTAGSWHRNESAAQVLVQLEPQRGIAVCLSGLQINGCPCPQQQGAMQHATAAWQVHSHVCRAGEHITVGNCKDLSLKNPRNYLKIAQTWQKLYMRKKRAINAVQESHAG